MSNAAQERTSERWRGVLQRQVHAPADRVWSIFRDFCGLNKWITTMRQCEMTEGEDGKPGCVRSMKAVLLVKTDSDESWAKEKLVLLDDENKCLSYEIVASSLGLKGYQAWMKVNYLDEKSCAVTWNFEVNPVPGVTEEAFAQRFTQGYGIALNFLEEYVKT